MTTPGVARAALLHPQSENTPGKTEASIPFESPAAEEALQKTVPIFVPTLHIEALLNIANANAANGAEAFENSQQCTMMNNMKGRRFVATNQKVACSSHAGRTTKLPKTILAAHPRR